MTGPDHYRKAEELASKAHEYLGQGDGIDTAVAPIADRPLGRLHLVARAGEGHARSAYVRPVLA